jgi:hypothetical protein
MHIFQNGSLVIHDVAPEDSGSYTCIAGNSCNIRHTEAPLLVVGMGLGRAPSRGEGRILSHLTGTDILNREDISTGLLAGLSFTWHSTAELCVFGPLKDVQLSLMPRSLVYLYRDQVLGSQSQNLQPCCSGLVALGLWHHSMWWQRACVSEDILFLMC